MNRNRHLSEKNYEKKVQPHMPWAIATKKRSAINPRTKKGQVK
jgi:hypothetical protein